jgi:uncharacterized protein (DUF608 family)
MPAIKRRDFLARAGGMLGISARLMSKPSTSNETVEQQPKAPCEASAAEPRDAGGCAHAFNGPYHRERLDRIAFPMGGMGAGMICLEGTGALSKFSLHHRPDLNSEPIVFAAVSVQRPKRRAFVLEGSVPTWKLHPRFSAERGGLTEAAALIWGLPRFREVSFEARFPFATVRLKDEEIPLEVSVTGWSPFIPGDADNASLPVAALEYTFINRGATPVDATFWFNAENFMARNENPFESKRSCADRIRPLERGFIAYGPGAQDRPWDEGYAAVWVDDSNAIVNHAWYRGGLQLYFDSIRMLWNQIELGPCETRAPLANEPSLGASICLPFTIAAGQRKSITVFLAWYVPNSNVFADFTVKDGVLTPLDKPTETYRPWYAGRFTGIEEVKRYWEAQYTSLKEASSRFSQTFYDSTFPPEVIEAVAANLSTLKSPTILRQTDGRIWAWEGSYDSEGGGGPGTCTHVYNYAQALAHLFPALERGLRETEFGPNQGKDGFQAHRALLPIRPVGDTPQGRALPAAADGQPGGIIKVYRDWRISGDTAWLLRLWPRIRSSLDYCIRAWDPNRRGWIEGAHLTTYDEMFWSADSVCTSVYAGALKAATLMGMALGEDVHGYAELLKKGIRRLETDLFNGEYFFQKFDLEALGKLRAQGDSVTTRIGRWFRGTPDERELAAQEGQPYQYGTGCFADGVLGIWLCWVSGIEDVLDGRKVTSHLTATHRYNLKTDMGAYAKVGRSILAGPGEAGLVLCTWPRGGRPSIPVLYADETWSGVEYQVGSHLVASGHIEEGLAIVRAVRQRYDGRVRNPFAEVEAGQWYARAMSSYALLQAFSGARFDAVDKVLYLKPVIKGDFRSFLSTATGYGTVGVKNGRPFVDVVSGEIPYTRIEYAARV